MASAPVLVLGLSLAAAAAGVTAEPAAGDEALLAAGRSLVAPFKQALKGALGEGMARGPAAAVEACRVAAPVIADGVATPGVRLGRSSDRLRNPDNQGPAWVAPLLADYLSGRQARAARVIELADGRVGYVEPIEVQPMCLACHGATPAAGLAELLAEHYPQDRATGYRPGDLRGVFWAEFDRPR